MTEKIDLKLNKPTFTIADSGMPAKSAAASNNASDVKSAEKNNANSSSTTNPVAAKTLDTGIGQTAEKSRDIGVSISKKDTKMISDNAKLLEYGITLDKPLVITKELAEKMKAKGKKGFWESLKDGVKNMIPFASASYEAYKGLKLLVTVKKLEKEGFDKLTKDEREQIILFQLEQAEETNRNSSFMGKVGTTLSYLPAFAGEFMLTGGLYRIGAAGAKVALSQGLKTAATKVAQVGVRKAGLKATAAFVTQKSAEVALGAAFRSAGLGHRALNGYFQRRVASGFENTENDLVYGKTSIEENKENRALTAGKAIADNYIETLSEQSGAMFSYAITKPVGNLLKLSKIPILGKIFNPSKGAQNFMTKTGFNGMFEEYMEERFGGFLRGTINLDNNGKTYTQHVLDSTIPSLEQSGVELTTTALWGGALANGHAAKSKILGKFANNAKKSTSCEISKFQKEFHSEGIEIPQNVFNTSDSPNLILEKATMIRAEWRHPQYQEEQYHCLHRNEDNSKLFALAASLTEEKLAWKDKFEKNSDYIDFLKNYDVLIENKEFLDKYFNDSNGLTFGTYVALADFSAKNPEHKELLLYATKLYNKGDSEEYQDVSRLISSILNYNFDSEKVPDLLEKVNAAFKDIMPYQITDEVLINCCKYQTKNGKIIVDKAEFARYLIAKSGMNEFEISRIIDFCGSNEKTKEFVKELVKKLNSENQALILILNILEESKINYMNLSDEETPIINGLEIKAQETVRTFIKLLKPENQQYISALLKVCKDNSGNIVSETVEFAGNLLVNKRLEQRNAIDIIRACKSNKNTQIFAENLIKKINIGTQKYIANIIEACKNNSGELIPQMQNLANDFIDSGILNQQYIAEILHVCKNRNGELEEGAKSFAKELINNIKIKQKNIMFIVSACKNDNGKIIPQSVEFAKKLIDNKNIEQEKVAEIVANCRQNGEFISQIADFAIKLINNGYNTEAIAEILKFYRFDGLLTYTESLAELSLSERRKVLAEMFNVTKYDRSLSKVPLEIKKIMPLMPTNLEEYNKFMPKLQKSLGLDIIPLKKEQLVNFAKILKNFTSQNSELSKIDLDSAKIELSFSRNQLINQLLERTKNLSENDRNVVADYFGLHFGTNSKGQLILEGYPVTTNNGAKLAEVQNPEAEKIIRELKSIVKEFALNNTVTIQNAHQLSAQLTELFHSFPELLMSVGKVQHGTHHYTVDIHTLKVMQGIINNPDFQSLSHKDQEIMLIATLFHDITKTEGVPDHEHAQNSAFDTELILKKLNLSQERINKIYALIYSHEWYGDLNKMLAKTDGHITPEIEKKMEESAFALRTGNTFKMAKMFTVADLNAVQKNGEFYSTHGINLEKLSNLVNEKIQMLQQNNLLLPQTKVIPKASELQVDGEIVQEIAMNGITNKVIYLDKLENDKKLTFLHNGQERVIDPEKLDLIVHGLDSEESLVTASTFTEHSSKGLSSTSYINYQQREYHVFRNQGLVLNVDNADIISGVNGDAGSGCGKDHQAMFNYLFMRTNTYKEGRTYYPAEIKKALNLTDEQYAEFVNKYKDKSFEDMERINPECAKALRNLFNSIANKKRSHGRSYNEILVSKFNDITAVFCQGYDGGHEVTPDKLPEYLRKFAADNNLPIIYFGK